MFVQQPFRPYVGSLVRFLGGSCSLSSTLRRVRGAPANRASRPGLTGLSSPSSPSRGDGEILLLLSRSIVISLFNASTACHEFSLRLAVRRAVRAQHVSLPIVLDICPRGYCRKWKRAIAQYCAAACFTGCFTVARVNRSRNLVDVSGSLIAATPVGAFVFFPVKNHPAFSDPQVSFVRIASPFPAERLNCPFPRPTRTRRSLQRLILVGRIRIARKYHAASRLC